jgi:hypothetical protein
MCREIEAAYEEVVSAVAAGVLAMPRRLRRLAERDGIVTMLAAAHQLVGCME